MKRWRRQLCRGLVGILLFTQWAVAAYACPGLAPQRADSVVALAAEDAMARMPGCDGMGGRFDAAAPNLCAEHCKAGQQSDQTPAAAVPPVLLHGLYVVAAPSASSGPPRSAGASTGLHVAAAPPLSILHCCFRV